MNMLGLNAVTTLPAPSAPKGEKAAAPQPPVVAKVVAEAESETPEAIVQAPANSYSANSIRFSLGGDDGKQVIVEIYDAEKDVLVRTIPYEVMLEKNKGMVLNVKA